MATGRFLTAIEKMLGSDRVISDAGRLSTYECDALTHFRGQAQAVVFPRNTREVQDLVRLCAREEVPITPRGAGTGLSSGATPTTGGVVIETALMRTIRQIDAQDQLAIAEPGVVNAHLDAAARAHGLAYAPDPSSQGACTLGGNVAENASGPHGMKYGGTREHILGLEIVLPDGEIVRLDRSRADLSGPDLIGLFVGSEGTLGIVTEITCRLIPRPTRSATLLASFSSMRAACEAVSAIVARGIVPAALEALDERTIEIVEASSSRAGYPKDAAAVLLAELDGSEVGVQVERESIEAIFAEHGALSSECARDPEHAARLWKGRKAAFGAMGRLAPDLYVQDAVVPRSQLPNILPRIYSICDEAGLIVSNVFHAGEGNLHPSISYDSRDAEQSERVMLAGRRIIEACLEVGGTLSGEHGIGLEKREFMDLLFDADTLQAMRRVRDTIDPHGVMNPDKVLPMPGACGEAKQTRRKTGRRTPPQS